MKRYKLPLVLLGKGLFIFLSVFFIYVICIRFREDTGEKNRGEIRMTNAKEGTKNAPAEKISDAFKEDSLSETSAEVEKNIRVLLKNGDSIYYDCLYLCCDTSAVLEEQTDFKSESFKQKETETGTLTQKKIRYRNLKKKELVNIKARMEEAKIQKVLLTPSDKNGLIYFCDKDGNQKGEGYSGCFYIEKTKEGLVVVNEVLIETYLKYVLPSEMPTYFSKEALMAQAVCARTFAYRQMKGKEYAAFGADLDDSTSFQVYHKRPRFEVTDKAVEETKGLVLTYGKELITCYYYSTSCGYSQSMEVWNATSPAYFLTGNTTSAKKENLSLKKNFHSFINTPVESFDDNSPYYRWEAGLSFSLGVDKELGRIKKISIKDRSRQGFVTSLVLEGEFGNRELTRENDIRKALSPYITNVTLSDKTVYNKGIGLPSACFEIKSQKNGMVKLVGGGFGHGIGMSQYGADKMGQKGYTWKEILAYYYPNTELVVME